MEVRGNLAAFRKDLGISSAHLALLERKKQMKIDASKESGEILKSSVKSTDSTMLSGGPYSKHSLIEKPRTDILAEGLGDLNHSMLEKSTSFEHPDSKVPYEEEKDQFHLPRPYNVDSPYKTVLSAEPAEEKDNSVQNDLPRPYNVDIPYKTVLPAEPAEEKDNSVQNDLPRPIGINNRRLEEIIPKKQLPNTHPVGYEAFIKHEAVQRVFSDIPGPLDNGDDGNPCDDNIYNENNFMLKAFTLTNSVLPRIWLGVLISTAWSSIFVALYETDSVRFTPFILNPLIISLLGVVLGLLLAFRTNTAYDRFMEARKLWGSMQTSTRLISSLVWLHVEAIEPKDMEKKKGFLNLLLALSYATKHHLRSEHGTLYDDLQPLVKHLPAGSITEGANTPREISFHLNSYAKYLQKNRT